MACLFFRGNGISKNFHLLSLYLDLIIFVYDFSFFPPPFFIYKKSATIYDKQETGRAFRRSRNDIKSEEWEKSKANILGYTLLLLLLLRTRYVLQLPSFNQSKEKFPPSTRKEEEAYKESIHGFSLSKINCLRNILSSDNGFGGMARGEKSTKISGSIILRAIPDS